MITCTVGGVSYPIANDQLGAMAFSIEDRLENRSILTITLLDTAGTANFTRGQQVVLSDSIQGVLYSGFVQSSSPRKFGLSVSEIGHTLTCMDKQYLVDKRTNSKNYLNYYAGDVVADFVSGTLGNEGITAPVAVNRDTTTADFNQGTLSGTVGFASTTTDGDLELVKAGSDVTISENTTAAFSTGTLTNVTASSNELIVQTQEALCLTSQQPGATSGGYITVQFWSGSLTVGVSDTLIYDLWIADSSPQKVGSVDLGFSDGSYLRTYSGIIDQNGMGTYLAVDLENFAVDQWYTRTFSLASLSGKTVTSAYLCFGGSSSGTYTSYFKNIYLGSQSSSKFFSPTTTSLNMTPAVANTIGFSPTATKVTVVSVFTPSNSYRISSAYTISTATLLKSSLISWVAVTPGNSSVTVSASYDGGTTYQPCTNNAALPNLLAGATLSGLTLTLKETFSLTGADPTTTTGTPALASVNVQVLSAPTATKSDITTRYATATEWNSGTYTSTVLNGSNNLTLGTYTRDWSNHSTTGQTFFAPTGATQSASSGAYVLSLQSATGGPGVWATSRLDFLGQLLDFTLDVDINWGGPSADVMTAIQYRATAWTGSIFEIQTGYAVYMNNSYYGIGYGSPPLLGSSAPATVLAYAPYSIVAGTTYHLKIVVSGSQHSIYFNGETTPSVTVVDSNIMGTGYIALDAHNADNNNTGTATFDNVVCTPIVSGSWLSPSVSINSLGTAGGSLISWTELNTSNPANSVITVQTSIDGGSTYQTCTNGSTIPGLTAGTSVTGKSVITKASLSTVTGALPPILAGINWRVLGAYPGSSGTRSTAPMGNDMSITRTVGSGWGTAFDGQTWTQTGTGTTAVGSNVETIANTTGDVHMHLGTGTGTDLDGTCRFKLSASTITAGMELRYVDANNYYRLAVSTTFTSIIKVQAGVATVLSTVSNTVPTNTLYRMRFRIVGSNLYGNVWAADGLTYEPTTWTIVATD